MKTLQLQVPTDLLVRACSEIGKKVSSIPFSYRGIRITHELIAATMTLLNSELNKTLPQNSRNAAVGSTPDGLDRRIKETLGTNLRTANIISDVFEKAGIVDIVQIENKSTGRIVKGTKLRDNWCWN